MTLFSRDALKRSQFGETLLRRTPLIYGNILRFFAEVEEGGPGGAPANCRSERIDKIVKVAKKTDYYRATPLSHEPNDWPRLDKEQVREAPERFYAPAALPVSPAATGGTTGAPLKLRRSWRSVIAEQAALDFLASKAGVQLGKAKVAVLRGDTVKDLNDLTPPFWSYRSGGRVLALSSHHLCAQTVKSIWMS